MPLALTLLQPAFLMGLSLNALLIREVYAQVITVLPNARYQDLFLKLQREARELGKEFLGE